MNNLKDIHNRCRLLFKPTLVVLSGFQWTIWRIYTTQLKGRETSKLLFYQDFNEQFEGYTQPWRQHENHITRCFIRISMNNLKDIHNLHKIHFCELLVVLSGFQWTIWRIYTTVRGCNLQPITLFYQDFNEQFCCKSTEKIGNMQIYMKLFWYFRKKHYLCTNKFEGYTQ